VQPVVDEAWMILHIPSAWHEFAQRLSNAPWRRIAVLGGTDVGKPSFCRFLGGFLHQAGHRVGLLDTDLGQKLVGPPACVTLGSFGEGGQINLEHIRFVGEVSPAANMAGTIAASARLATKYAQERLIVNTSGLVGGSGVPLKRWKLDAPEPDHVVALVRGEELASALSPLPRGLVHPLPSSSAARRKSRADREGSRRSALLTALAGCRPVSLPRAVAEDLHRHPPEADRWRLCGLADTRGEDRGIGLLRGADFIDRSEVWNNLDPARIHRVRLGMIALDLGELPGSLQAQGGHPASCARASRG
jgi:polynucleotide 5'-hydroxyl-kinase GRC3/NOL9